MTGVILTERDIEDALSKGQAKHLMTHLENVVIQKALIKTRGNISKAAELLSMNRGTVNKIRERAEG